MVGVRYTMAGARVRGRGRGNVQHSMLDTGQTRGQRTQRTNMSSRWLANPLSVSVAFISINQEATRSVPLYFFVFVCLSVCLSLPFAGLLIGDCLIGLLEQSVDSVCLWQATTFSPNSPRPPVFQNTEKERKATPREGFVEKECFKPRMKVCDRRRER